MLDKLPYDVLTQHLFPYLDGTDLAHLCQLSHDFNYIIDQSVWRAMYKGTFGNDQSVETGDWVQNYANRFNSSVYVWGKLLPSVLGYPSPQTRQVPVGIDRPLRAQLDVKVRQITSGGWGFAILTIDGQIWQIGSVGAYKYNNSTPICLTSTFTRPFRSISSGRDHILALSESSECWELRGTAAPQRIQIPSIITVSAGWNLDAALCHDIGVIFWKKPSAAPNYTVVPGTRTGPNIGIDSKIVAGNGFILLLDDAQLLHFIDLRGDDINKKIILESERAVHIVATFCRFSVICESGKVFFGKVENDQPPLIQELELEEPIEFCDIALGDYHTLGLDRSGNIYAWGCESQRCGSFGLGPSKDVLALGGTSVRVGFNVHDLRLDAPKKLNLRKALHISAGGWQSAAIISDNTLT